MSGSVEHADQLSHSDGSDFYRISEAAEASGLSAKMIRYYESVKLIPEPKRTYGNYRVYGSSDVHTLRFIKRARDLGFSMAQVKALLDLWQQKRPSAEIKNLALEHLENLETRISDLEMMRNTLRNLAETCHGDDKADCPILDDLSGSVSETKA